MVSESKEQFLTSSSLMSPNNSKSISLFDGKVYKACSNIPKGKVSTYKIIAQQIGCPKAFRAVGSSLKKNPYAPKVPCHRVVSSNLSLGGFYGSTDPKSDLLKRKLALLIEEGVLFQDDKHCSLIDVKNNKSHHIQYNYPNTTSTTQSKVAVISLYEF